MNHTGSLSVGNATASRSTVANVAAIAMPSQAFLLAEKRYQILQVCDAVSGKGFNISDTKHTIHKEMNGVMVQSVDKLPDVSGMRKQIEEWSFGAGVYTTVFVQEVTN